MRAIDRQSDAIETAEWRYPQYTAIEVAADRALHLFALPAATVAVGWLCLAAIPTADAEETIACLIYGCGLIGMLTASAAYNLCPPGRRKELLRWVDHAMIFVMIAGTCTPFALSAFPASISLLICTLVWSIAATGALLKLAFPRQFERLLLALYLVAGWTIFGMSRAYADNLSDAALFLLFGGGVAYSFGAYIQAKGRIPLHNVAWHGLVLLGAGLHWAAVANQVVNWRDP